jgi:hypothetical protein
MQSGGLLARLRRLPETDARSMSAISLPLADDVLSSIEARLLWSRYGL